MKKIWIAILFLTIILGSGCNKGDNSEMSRMKFRLTDAPADFDRVNVDIIGAQAIIDDTVINLVVNEGVYNLLDFVNGKDTLLVDQNVPSGKLSQIRLILGEDNSLAIGNDVFDLKTPSAQQSGLKLNVHADLVQGVAYEYVIDFDAARSVVETGNGKYILKPVLKVFTNSISGAISGVVKPAEAKPLIYAISESKDSLSVFADEATGKFMFRGMAEGKYQVSFIPVSPFLEKLVNDVEVKTGSITVMDTVKFE